MHPSIGDLTHNEVRVQMFIHGYIAQHGHSPTIREIRDELGHVSTSTSEHIVYSLEKKGVIYRLPGIARNIKLWFQRHPDRQRREPTQVERRLQIFARSFSVRYGFQPSAKQIAEGLGMDRKIVNEVLEMMRDKGVRL